MSVRQFSFDLLSTKMSFRELTKILHVVQVQYATPVSDTLGKLSLNYGIRQTSQKESIESCRQGKAFDQTIFPKSTKFNYE